MSGEEKFKWIHDNTEKIEIMPRELDEEPHFQINVYMKDGRRYVSLIHSVITAEKAIQDRSFDVIFNIIIDKIERGTM